VDGGTPDPARPQDDPIIRADLVATAVLVLTSVAAAVSPDGLGLVHAGVSIAAFVAGTVAFLWAYAIAIGRSRHDLIGIGGLYFLAGDVAPRSERTLLRGIWAAQIVAVVAAASVRPFTSVAFGILAPMLGLGLMGLWGARHGSFAPRPEGAGRS
jgi:hypothetical protein